MEDRMVHVWRPNRVETIAIPRRHHDLIKKFILTELTLMGEVTLAQLITAAEQKLGSLFGAELHWYLLQIKMDLAARSMIKIVFAPGRVQIIKLSPRSKAKVNNWLQSVRSG